VAAVSDRGQRRIRGLSSRRALAQVSQAQENQAGKVQLKIPKILIATLIGISLGWFVLGTPGAKKAPYQVLNDVPVASAAGWTLNNTPTTTGAACYLNGIRQSTKPSADGLFQPDYVLKGRIITSPYWGKIIASGGGGPICDYYTTGN
jgi:hypothetical protein